MDRRFIKSGEGFYVAHNEDMNGKIMIVEEGTLLEVLDASDNGEETSSAFLAVHRKGCHVGLPYRGSWPASIVLYPGNGDVKVIIEDFPLEFYRQIYGDELSKSACSAVARSYIDRLPPEDRIIAAIYALKPEFATIRNIALLCGNREETVSRSTSTLCRGVLIKKARGVSRLLRHEVKDEVILDKGLDKRILDWLTH